MSSGERVDGHKTATSSSAELGSAMAGPAVLGAYGSKREGGGKGAHLAARTVALGGLVAAETAP